MSLSTSMPAVVYLSFGLTGLVNPLLKRLDLQAGLRHPELVLVFTMMAMASPIPTFFTVRFLSQIVDPFYFASPHHARAVGSARALRLVANLSSGLSDRADMDYGPPPVQYISSLGDQSDRAQVRRGVVLPNDYPRSSWV